MNQIELRPMSTQSQSQIQSKLDAEYKEESKLPYVQGKEEGSETKLKPMEFFEEPEKKYKEDELVSGNRKAVKSGFKKKKAPTIEKDLSLPFDDRTPEVYKIDYQTINKEKDRHRFGFHKYEDNPQTLDAQSKLNLQGFREPHYLNPNEVKTNIALQSGYSGYKQDKQWLDTGEVFSKNVERYKEYAVLQRRVANVKE